MVRQCFNLTEGTALSTFNALAESLGSTLTHFVTKLLMLLIAWEIREICLKTQAGKDKNQKGQGLKTCQRIDQDNHLTRNTQTQTDGDVSFKRKKKSGVEEDQDDPPQNKLLKGLGNPLVNLDPVAKMMNQVNMTSTQSKNEGIEITTLLQQISQEQDWGDLTDKGLAEAAKNLWHANIAKDMLKDYMENDNIPTNCTFLSVPEINSKILCQIPSQAKGHDLKFQKQQKAFVNCIPQINQNIGQFDGYQGKRKLTFCRNDQHEKACQSHRPGGTIQCPILVVTKNN